MIYSIKKEESSTASSAASEKQLTYFQVVLRLHRNIFHVVRRVWTARSGHSRSVKVFFSLSGILVDFLVLFFSDGGFAAIRAPTRRSLLWSTRVSIRPVHFAVPPV